MGRWTYECVYKSYLEFFPPSGLLAAAEWPGVATNELNMFWHERFMLPTPNELVLRLFPFLPGLEATLKEMGKAATLSMKAAPYVLRHVAKVLIQDSAAGMSQQFPGHPVHRLLETSDVFR